MLKCFKSLVPHLPILEFYQTTPIWSLGRLTEAHLLTRQPRVDRTTHGASRVSSQVTASTSNQAQPPRDDLRGEDRAPRTINVEQQQGQQGQHGQALSKPRAFRPDQLGSSGSLHEKRFDDDKDNGVQMDMLSPGRRRRTTVLLDRDATQGLKEELFHATRGNQLMENQGLQRVKQLPLSTTRGWRGRF